MPDAVSAARKRAWNEMGFVCSIAETEMAFAVALCVVGEGQAAVQRRHSLCRIAAALHVHRFVRLDLSGIEVEDFAQQRAEFAVVARRNELRHIGRRG
jgi:hypothetical protein